jgi:predicted transcriptional regulator
MISSLKKMLPAIENWPEEDQQALADAALEIAAARAGFYALTPDEERAVAEGLAQADRGDFATEEEIAALWRRFKQ